MLEEASFFSELIVKHIAKSRRTCLRCESLLLFPPKPKAASARRQKRRQAGRQSFINCLPRAAWHMKCV